MRGKIREKLKPIGLLCAFLVLLSLLLLGVKQSAFLLIERTDFSDSMASMFSMLLLTIVLLMLAKKKAISLSVFPDKFSKGYLFFTAVTLVLLVATPSNYEGGVKPICLLIYSSIITPVFEETLFRGFVWNRLNRIFEKEWVTYAVTTVLFALWHFGYVDAIAFRVQEGLLTAMLWKVITGFCFGIVLGLVRMKTKNCYSTMLLHGVLNVFGR